MSDAPILDFIEAKQRADAGMAHAAQHSRTFMDAALAEIARLPPSEYQGEDIRAILVGKHITPKSHQAWGALICTAVRRGYLIPTGIYRPTSSVRTHGHRTQVYSTRRAA